MPLCPQVTNAPVTVSQTASWTVATIVPAGEPATVEELAVVATTADNALVAASDAQSAALGKNTIFYATTAPTGTHTEGDTWFDTENGYKIHKWDGTQWVATQFGSAAFGAGSVDLAALASGAVDATKLVDGAVTQEKVAANAIGANQIAANAIVAGKIAANAITSANIQAGQITSSLIAAGAITADKITADGITADKINGGTITGSIVNTSLLVAGNVCYGKQYLMSAMLYGDPSLAVKSAANFEAYIRYSGQPSTSNAANCYLSNSSGSEYFYRGTSSSERYKQDIVDLAAVPELDPAQLLNIPVRAFRYRPEVLDQDDDRAGVMIPGFIAEEVDQAFPIAADYADGVPESWNDRLLVPAMLALIQQQAKTIADLQSRVEALEARP